MQPRYTKSTGDATARGLMRLLDEQAELEYAVVQAILCDPHAGAVLAERLGARPFHFERLDLRTMFSAVCVAGDRRRRVVIHLVRLALREEGSWCERVHRDCRGPRWSTASVGAFFNEFHDAPTPMQRIALVQRVPLLTGIYDRRRQAEHHLRTACRILTGEAA